MNITKPLKLTLLISSLSSGGAERVMSTIANYWASKEWDITLITLDSIASDFYELDPRIKRIGLGLMGDSANILSAVKNNIYRLFKLRHAIKRSKPDVVVSFVDRMNILTLLSALGLGLKITVSERVDPSQHKIGSIWNMLRGISYPWADAIVVQNEHIRRWASRFRDSLVVVIPNPVVLNSGEQEGGMSLSDLIKLDIENDHLKIIAAMGRLSHQKGFDLLLKAFKQAAHSSPEWRLVIFGEGEERKNLTRIAHDLGIGDKVFFPGRVKNPMSLLRQAEIFVMPSRYEGFPNALCEAMACGLPVISFDCPSDLRAIIHHGVDGILIAPENIDALGTAMSQLMSDDSERKQIAKRAPEVVERFNVEKIMTRWEELLQQITG